MPSLSEVTSLATEAGLSLGGWKGEEYEARHSAVAAVERLQVCLLLFSLVFFLSFLSSSVSFSFPCSFFLSFPFFLLIKSHTDCHTSQKLLQAPRLHPNRRGRPKESQVTAPGETFTPIPHWKPEHAGEPRVPEETELSSLHFFSLDPSAVTRPQPNPQMQQEMEELRQ